MAQFVEFMKQARRMCNMQKDTCKDCPVGTMEGRICRLNVIEISEDDVEVERIVMDWAAEHPEPVYPSLEEAWNALFPDAYDKRVPCLRYFLPNDKYVKLCKKNNGRCCECRHQPIPAEIAEKLGIKPKEE